MDRAQGHQGKDAGSVRLAPTMLKVNAGFELPGKDDQGVAGTRMQPRRIGKRHLADDGSGQGPESGCGQVAQEVENLPGLSRLHREGDEILVLGDFGNPAQKAHMFRIFSLGPNDGEKDMDGFSVESLIIQAVTVDGDQAADLGGFRHLDVGNSHAVGAGGPGSLPGLEGLENLVLGVLEAGVLEGQGLGEGVQGG